MTTILQALREVLGLPEGIENFPDMLPYIGFFEYCISGLLLLVVVASIFKLLIIWAKND